LQGAATRGYCTHRLSESVFKGARVERAVLVCRPVTHRVVDVREDLKVVAAVDHPQDLGKIGPDDLGWLGQLPEQRRRLTTVSTEWQRGQRAIAPIKRRQVEHRRGRLAVEMGLPELNAGEDAQVGKQTTAAFNALVVA